MSESRIIHDGRELGWRTRSVLCMLASVHLTVLCVFPALPYVLLGERLFAPIPLKLMESLTKQLHLLTWLCLYAFSRVSVPTEAQW